MSKHIFWISSYPKSGNTLMRSILTALFFTENGKFDFEKLLNISQFEMTSLVKKNRYIFGDDYLKLNDTVLF